MSLPKETVESFQKAYRQSFNEDISFGEAQLMASELLSSMAELTKFYQTHKTDNAPGSLVRPDGHL
ncbi:MAG: hypothetical protein WCX97_02985 [Candidatus Magasanikbacteria bacterium]